MRHAADLGQPHGFGHAIYSDEDTEPLAAEAELRRLPPISASRPLRLVGPDP
ncbi:hypothetical protein BJY54_002412 [Streptomyces nodosus]|nr:hypothetical protein [Streptomyces nodosus]